MVYQVTEENATNEADHLNLLARDRIDQYRGRLHPRLDYCLIYS